MSGTPWDSISWINKGLGLSSYLPAQDPRILSRCGVSTVISLGPRRAVEGEGWQVVHFPDLDDELPPGDREISAVIAALAAARERGKTLVHCTEGSSWCAGVVVAYLAQKLDLDWDTVLAKVALHRPVVDVDPDLREALCRWLQRHRRPRVAAPAGETPPQVAQTRSRAEGEGRGSQRVPRPRLASAGSPAPRTTGRRQA